MTLNATGPNNAWRLVTLYQYTSSQHDEGNAALVGPFLLAGTGEKKALARCEAFNATHQETKATALTAAMVAGSRSIAPAMDVASRHQAGARRCTGT
jgi:hypothetical protein